MSLFVPTGTLGLPYEAASTCLDISAGPEFQSSAPRRMEDKVLLCSVVGKAVLVKRSCLAGDRIFVPSLV